MSACAARAISLNMQEVRVGIVGLGNIGSGRLTIPAANAEQIAVKLSFRLTVTVAHKAIPEALGAVMRTADCYGGAAACGAPRCSIQIIFSSRTLNWTRDPRHKPRLLLRSSSRKPKLSLFSLMTTPVIKPAGAEWPEMRSRFI
jgi:hypothetical protein